MPKYTSTSLYVIVDNPVEASEILNSDLSKIQNWAKTWLVTFNASKTESLIISRKSQKPNHPTLFLNNTPILEVSEHKHLGIDLSNDGKWSTTIKFIVDKAWKRIYILRQYKFLLNRKVLERMYFSFIRPLLEYGDIVWSNCTFEQSNIIESIQLEAARIVTGATKLCAIAKLYQDLQWQKLSERRKYHKLVLFYKMNNNLVPDYLQSMLPTRNQSRTTYTLRNNTDFTQIQFKTSLYRESFLPSTVYEWNNPPADTKKQQHINNLQVQIDR